MQTSRAVLAGQGLQRAGVAEEKIQASLRAVVEEVLPKSVFKR